MIIPDVNLLIYAYNDQDAHHAAAKNWLETSLNGSNLIGFPWLVTTGFIRIMTHPKILQTPMSGLDAVNIVQSWLDTPVARIPAPGPDHANLLFRFIADIGTAGNLTTDAQIAAIAAEHQATIYSNDTDFSRFSGIRWKNPLRAKSNRVNA